MFCPNCGVPTSEGSAFCPNCGAKLTQAQETPVQPPVAAAPEAPAEYPTEVLVNPAPEAPAEYPTEVLAEPAPEAQEQLPWEPASEPLFAQADFDPAPKKKTRKEKGPVNKKKLGITLAIIGVLLAAVTTLTVIFWGPIAGFFIKTFGSPEDYFQHVEKQAIADGADSISSYYGTMLDNLSSGGNAMTDTAAKGTMRLQVSDKLSQLLSMTDAQMDLTWLNDATIAYETVIDGELYRIDMKLAISGTDIVDVSMIMNVNTGEYFIGMPSLNDAYLHYDPYAYFGNYAGIMAPSNTAMMNLLSDEALIKALPDEKTVNTLLRRYLQIIVETATDVEKSSETLEIGDLEQKVTVLEYELTQKGLLKIVKAVLKEAKNDKDLKKVINNFADYLEDQGAIGDADSVYGEFQDAVETALDAMSYVSGGSDTLLVITDYVNGKSEIIGRKLSVQGQDILEYATITKGKKFATEWNFGDDIAVLRGEGTISGDTREGDYVLNLQGVDYLRLSASYNKKKLADGMLDGRFCIRPSATMLEAMGLNSQVQSVISGMDLGLELVISNNGNSASGSYGLVSGNEVLLGLTAEGSTTGKQEVTLPGNTVDVRYADDWAADLDLDKIVTALRKTSVPADIVDSLAQAIDELNNPYYYDDYYNDSYYDDYFSDYYDDYFSDYYYGG